MKIHMEMVDESLSNPSTLPKSRQEALLIGAKFYFNGKPCRWARHVAPRYTSVNRCVLCQSIAAKRLADKDRITFNRKIKERRDLDRNRLNALARASYWIDPEKSRIDGLTKYYRNHEINKTLAKARRDCDLDKDRERNRLRRQKYKEQIAQYNQCYKIANRHIYAAAEKARYARKKDALPSWVNLESIKIFYKQARRLTIETGIKHEVDHIIPLQGINVCGLHVPWNLQIVTKIDNIRKSNRLVEDDTCV